MFVSSPRFFTAAAALALLVAALCPASAHAYIYGGGGSYGYNFYNYGGYGYGYNGYTGPGGGADTPHRGTWQTRFNQWAQREAAWEQASYYNTSAPCGIWGRAPAGCYLYTRPYIPWIDGDR